MDFKTIKCKLINLNSKIPRILCAELAKKAAVLGKGGKG